MKKEVIYSIKSPYRESLDVISYTFGSGEKTCCIVGSTRGNEIEQMYVCSRIVRRLKKLEEQGRICENKSITVIPCINYYSMNIGKRFWTMDNTDINRMFPGYELGETTQRIAAGVFEKINDYKFGIQLATFYQDGEFLPHVKIMKTEFENEANLADFGLSYALIRKPRPYDTTTLNYNWQIWNCHAFSLYATSTGHINENSTKTAVDAVMRFLTRNNIIDWNIDFGYHTQIIKEKEILQLNSSQGGIYIPSVNAGAEIKKGDVIGKVLHPLESYVLENITAPCDGIVFFAYNTSIINQNQVVFKIIPF